MKELLDKLSSYNIFNFLLPGIVFALLSKEVTGIDLSNDNVLLGIFLYYFYGLIVSRIGSLVIESLLKAIRFIKFSSYSDFIKASKVDNKIDLLLESNNMYRTLLSLVFCFFLLGFYSYLENKMPGIKDIRYILFGIFITVILLFSYKKQTNYIVQRVKTNLEKE